MTWEPPPRPEWVRAINDGRILPIAEVAELPLTRDQLLAEARATLGVPDGGVADFGSDDFLEPLAVLLPALEHEAELTVMGRWMTRRFLLRFLEVRLQLAAYVRDDPGVVDEEIRAPWFVDRRSPDRYDDPARAAWRRIPPRRVPEGWELLRPVPPPSPEPDEFAADARIPLADRELRLPGQVAGELDAIHVYRGRMHKECLSAMSFAFRSEEFTARYHVPSYADWYERCDLRPAYDAHRLVLQILQRRFGDVHWVLKSPVHLAALPTLFAVYPDARWRSPTAIRSPCSPRSPAWWRRCGGRTATASTSPRSVASTSTCGRARSTIWSPRRPTARSTPHACTTCTTPTSCRTRSVWSASCTDALGRSLPTGAPRRRCAPTSPGRPKDQHGTHEYTFADLELDPVTERARFARYQRHFSVPEEPTR